MRRLVTTMRSANAPCANRWRVVARPRTTLLRHYSAEAASEPVPNPDEFDLNKHPMPEKARKVYDSIQELNFRELLALGKALQKSVNIDLTKLVDERQKAMTAFYQMHVKAAQAASVAPVAAAPAAAASATAAEAKPAADAAPAAAAAPLTGIATIKLLSFPDGAKFNILREVRKLKPGMNLMDSKKMVENLPQILVKNAPAAEITQWKTALESVGAVVEIVS